MESSRPWPRGASRPAGVSLALALASGAKSLALALALTPLALALALDFVALTPSLGHRRYGHIGWTLPAY